MSDVPTKVWLVLEDNHFALKRGDEKLTDLSFEDVLGIANNAVNFRQTITAQMRPGSLSVTPVRSMAASWDALGINILIQVGFQPNGNAVFALSPDHSKLLADRLLELAATQPAFRSKN